MRKKYKILLKISKLWDLETISSNISKTMSNNKLMGFTEQIVSWIEFLNKSLKNKKNQSFKTGIVSFNSYKNIILAISSLF